MRSNYINLHTYPWTWERHRELVRGCANGFLRGINGECECTFCDGVTRNWKRKVAGGFYTDFFNNFHPRYESILHSSMESIGASEVKFRALIDFLCDLQRAAGLSANKSGLKGIGHVMFGKILAIVRVMVDGPWEHICIPFHA